MKIEEIASQAWNQTKHATDPVFTLCAPDHRSALIYKAECVQRTGKCADPFEHRVLALLQEPAVEPVRDTARLVEVKEPDAPAPSAGVLDPETPAEAARVQPESESTPRLRKTISALSRKKK